MADISSDQLGRIVPHADLAKWLVPLNTAMQEFSVNSAQRAAAFLAQLAHESGEFQHLDENLNYSAQRLCQVWPSRFPTLAVAEQYAGNPKKLANRVYSGRLGNGNEASGDGWNFHGRGLIQLTGRANYSACAKALAVELTGKPELLLDSGVAARSAGWFWKSRGLNELADHAPGESDDDDFVRITTIINGATTGLPGRMRYWSVARQVLGA
jgi:putative chitinase